MQFFTKYGIGGQPLLSLMWPCPVSIWFVWFGSYSCSAGSRGCGRAHGTELIELVTVAIRLISHIGSPSVCPGGPTVWQKGSHNSSAGQHLLLLNTSCHSSLLSCRRTGCSEAENRPPGFIVVCYWKRPQSPQQRGKKGTRKWCASGQRRFL